MKRLLYGSLLCCFCLIIISWGSLGHRTVASIAERHLSPSAKAAVADLLSGESLEDISTWADEIRSNPSYRQTASWHFLNLPSGLDHAAFMVQVRSMSQENVVSSVHHFEEVLANPRSNKSEKTEALKFLVHFVGDIHQPMHISHKEDKGGNTIQLRYDGKGTNLHALWDTKLLETEHSSEGELATAIDHADTKLIKQWQASSPEEWAWESYQISSKLYLAADQKGGKSLDQDYYHQYMPVVEQRIEQAGIRLAGLLNQAFKNYRSAARSPGKQPSANIAICDKVYSTRYFKSSGMTLLNLGAPYPNQTLTVVIRDDVANQFPDEPAKYFRGKTICVSGEQELYKGRPQIVIRNKDQIKIQQ